MLEAAQRWHREHHFLLRRLHSLTGIVPVGVFLIEHLFTNSLAFLGAEKFNEHVRWLHELPYLIALEWLGIFLPLAFHAGYGIVIARTAAPNVDHYAYADNWRYTLQRVTGYIAFVYIIFHLLHFRFAFLVGGPEYVGTADPFALTHAGFQHSWLPAPLMGLIYLVGTAAAVFHFCNGIVTFCITWGITVGDTARRRVGAVAAALGVLMFVWGALSLRAFQTAATTDYHPTEPNVEKVAQAHPRP